MSSLSGFGSSAITVAIISSGFNNGPSTISTNDGIPTTLNKVASPPQDLTYNNGNYTVYNAASLSNINNGINSSTFFNFKTSLLYVYVGSTFVQISKLTFVDFTVLKSIYIAANSPISGYGFGQGDSILRNCTSLTSINVDPNNPNLADVSGVLFDKNITYLLCYPCAKSGSSYIVPTTVTTIRSGGFTNILFTSITIPNSLTTIEQNGFYGSPSQTIYVKPANTYIINGYTTLFPSGSTLVIDYNYPTITPATTQTVTYPQTTSTTLTARSNSTGALTYYLSTSGATTFGNASITTSSSIGTTVVAGNLWVAVGEGTNSIAYSSNGTTWTGLGTACFGNYGGMGVAWNGIRWVAVGSGTDSIAYSSNGTTWTGLGKDIFGSYGKGVAWNGTLWVAVGLGSNTIAYSSNGITWTGLGKTIFSNRGYRVAWNGTLWVAVGTGTGTNSIAYSSNGTTWTGLGTGIFENNGYGVAWNGTLWVAVGNGANSIAYSSNGTTWTGLGEAVFSSVGYGVAWNGTLWVAVGQGSNNIVYSSNGTTWTGITGTTVFSNYGYGVAWNGTLWVAVGYGTNSIAYSNDGTTWTGRGTAVFLIRGYGVASNAGYAPITLYNGNVSITGPGTITAYVTEAADSNYAAITTPVTAGTINVQGSPTITPATTQSVAYPGTSSVTITPTSNSAGAFTYYLSTSGATSYGNAYITSSAGIVATRLIAVGTGTNTIAYSDDGITWTGLGSTIFSGNDVAWNGTRWVAVGQGTTNTIAYSSDGITWTGLGITVFSDFGYGIASNKTSWVAVGSGTNSIAYSNDGLIWTGVTLKTIFSEFGNRVASNGTRWVAVGQGPNSNTIAYSNDGITWTGLSMTIFSTYGNAVAWNGTIWVAVGEGINTIAYSNDGIIWSGVTNSTSIFSNGGNGGMGIAWNGTRWVAVGQGTNSIAYSNDGLTWTGVTGSTSIFSTQGLGVTWNGTRWIAVGYGTNSIAYSNDGITWIGLGISIFYEGHNIASNLSSVTSYTGNISITGLGTINVLVTQAAAGIYSAVTTPVTAGTINVVAPTAPTITPNNRNVIYPTSQTFTVTNNGAGSYTIGGNNNPTLNLFRGITYYFDLNASGHPFWIKTTANTGTGDQYNDGVTNNGTQSGRITFSVPLNAPNIIYYICQYHGSMQGVINISDFGTTVTPTSNSAGAFTFSLQSGFPANTSINSSTGVVTIGGLGTIVALVTQTAAGIYSAVTTPVAAGTITVINAQTATITPASDSPGAFTYSLDTSGGTSSAIATINPTTGLVTITGGGTINVYVTQAASGNYTAITSPVLAGLILSVPTPIITPATTQNATYGQPSKVTVTPTSNSAGAFTFSLQPGYLGCTTIDPNTGVVTIGGTGTITVLATQAATSNYGPVTTPTVAGTIIVDFNPIPCFKENTQILTVDGYRYIQELRKGDLVKTVNHGYVAINIIGCQIIYNRKETILFDKIYKCTNENYPEIFEDLYITGLHAVLVDEITDEQQRQIKCVYNDNVFITDDKYRLPVCFDERATPHETDEDEQVVIFHLALDHENENLNYGIYANGLLVETTSIGLMKESGLIMVE
jgi:hypothetical protein